jgi:hypothetical protein
VILYGHDEVAGRDGGSEDAIDHEAFSGNFSKKGCAIGRLAENIER